MAVDGVRTLTIQATFATERAPGQAVEVAPVAIPAEPVAHDPAALTGLAGAFALPDPAAIAALAPRLARALGPSRVAAWAACRRSSECSCPASTRSSRRST